MSAKDSNTRTVLSIPFLVGIVLTTLIAIGTVACAGSGGGDDNAASEATTVAAADSGSSKGVTIGDGAQDSATGSNPKSLPESAAGSAGITANGNVFVVRGEPRRWTQVYDAAGTGSSPAVGVSVGGSTLAYVLQDGSVGVQQIDDAPGSASLVWGADATNPAAVAVDVSGSSKVFVLTADGTVHTPEVASTSDTSSVSDSLLWKSEQGAATEIAAVDSGVFVLHDGKVSFVATDGQAKSQDLPLEGIVKIDGRANKVAGLDADGKITAVDVAESEPKATVVWDGSGAESKVADISMGADVVMLLSDGTIREKSVGAADPAGGGRMVWNQVDKWGPAVAIGTQDKLIMFELKDGKSRWFDRSAPEGERGGQLFLGDGSSGIVSFAS